MTDAHWYHAAPIPAAFDVEIDGDTLTFGPFTTTILLRDDRSVFARPGGMNLQILFDSKTWSLSGVPGMAVGTLTARGG